MRSASSWDGAMRRNAKIEYESTLASRCVATSVDAKASWNKINANSRDGTLFVATSVDATAKAMQRNALCSVSSLDRALRKGKRAELELCDARVRSTARYASAIAGGAGVLRFAVCGGVLRMRTIDSERGPSWYHFGAI